MFHIIEPDTHLHEGEGPFRIRRIRPGLGIDSGDTGFGALGLVDRAHLSAGLLVDMHEHRDDEIVSYLRTGELTHTDSEGHSETVTPERLMVMNAGAGFSHEERMPEGEDIHMLQIFVRPREAGLEPAVQFAELEESQRENRWRLVVGPDDVETDAPATVRQNLFIRDTRVDADGSIEVPMREGYDQWLYLFSGTARLPDGTLLAEGAALAASDEERVEHIHAVDQCDLVLFEIQQNAPFTLAGSLSRGR